MRNRFGLAAALLVLVLGCGGGSEQTKGEDLAQRVTKLEDDLHQAKRQLIAQEQAIRTLNERQKSLEMAIDKLAYGAGERR